MGEQKTAPVAQVWVVMAKLMAVISQGDGLGQAIGQGFELCEMGRPILIAQLVEADVMRPALIAKTQIMTWELGGGDRLEKTRPQIEVSG